MNIVPSLIQETVVAGPPVEVQVRVRVSDWVCVQLEDDFTWESNLTCGK